MSVLRSSAPLPPQLRRFWRWSVGLVLLSALYSAVMTRLTHSTHPYGLNLIWGSDRWWDFLIFRSRFMLFGTPAFWTIPAYPFTYPAPLAVVFGLLYKLAHPLRVYLLGCGLAVIAWIAWLAEALHRTGISRRTTFAFAATIGMSAWPVWFLFVTANMEGLVALVLGIGVLACLRGRWWLGSALIGAAGAMKIYPLILLALFLSRRRFRELVFALTIAASITLGSLAILGPSVRQAEDHISGGIAFVKDAFVFSLAGSDSVCNHSLFVPLKQIVARTAHHVPEHRRSASSYLDDPQLNHQLLETPYEIYVACAACFGLALYFLRIRKLPVLNQLLALSTCAVLLPPISLDYTLLNLLLPFGMLCLYAARHPRTRPTPVLFACFAVLFCAGTFFTLHYRLAAPARTLALIVLLVASVHRPLPCPELDSPPQASPA